MNQKTLQTKVTGFAVQIDDFIFQTLNEDLKTLCSSWNQLFLGGNVGCHEISRISAPLAAPRADL